MLLSFCGLKRIITAARLLHYTLGCVRFSIIKPCIFSLFGNVAIKTDSSHELARKRSQLSRDLKKLF